MYILHHDIYADVCTRCICIYIVMYLSYKARSVEDETRSGHRNPKRNPNRNHETIVLGLFSFENLKRDVEW